MKKHIILLAAIFAAALVAPACYPDDVTGLKSDGLTISLFSDELETKAYNSTMETAIDHFDFFFFEDEAGTKPIAGMHGHATGSSVTLQTGKNQTYAALRKGLSYVYIVANYPGTINHSVDWILEDLLNLVVEYPIATGKATQVNPISGDEEETGDVSFNPNLVMDSYHKETNATDFTYTYKINPPTTINENRTVNVAMSRLAAKLILKINVAESVPGTMPTQTGQPAEAWTPVLKEMKAYYVNALNNKTTVRATPVQRSAIPASQARLYEYFTYPTPYPITASSDDPYKFTAAPVFTYPQTWKPDENGDPYFKIQMIWKSNYRGTSNFYYKVRVPRAANNGFCTLNRNTCYTVTVDLAVVDPENEYVELDANYKVVKWADSGWIGGDNLSAARFFNVPKTEYELFSRDSIEIPYYSSSAVTAYFEEISFFYYGNSTRPEYTFHYGNETDNSVLLPTTYNGSSLPTAARDRNTYTVEVVGKNVKVKHALTNVFTKRVIKVVIKNQDGDEETVTIAQHPSIEVVTIPTKTIFVNGHFARATEDVHVNGGNNEKIGVKWGPMKYLSDKGQYRYHSDDNSISGYWNWGSWQNSNYNGAESSTARIYPRPDKGIYGTVEGDWTFLAEPFMTIIAVSAFNESNCTYTYIQNNATQGPKKYRIGDPRVEGNLNLANYLYKPSTVRNNDGTTTTGTAEYRAWEEPLKVLIASQNANDGNIIAPRFLLSSSLNCMTDGGNSFVNAQKRAATYQEAGYPAGRWRLPTEAEIAFMIARQNEGIIPSVWGTTDYWCADGRVVHRGSNTNTYFSTHSGNAYNRFVYDLWYWGDDPMTDTETYYPNMHRVTPNN